MLQYAFSILRFSPRNIKRLLYLYLFSAFTAAILKRNVSTFQVAPMSMQASFGAEAVPLRDAFVSRLKTLTEVLTKLRHTLLV